MKFFKLILPLLAIISLDAYSAPKYYPGSFALKCENSHAELNNLPLSFYEFKDDIGNLDILPNYLDIIHEISPITFTNFKQDFLKIALEEKTFPLPQYEYYDSIVLPPKGCSVVLAASSSRDPRNALVNKELWEQTSEATKQYLLFELFLENYLEHNMSRSDYRRFALYIATGKFREFTDEEKIIFLKHYGIDEFNYSGVSIDLKRDIIFYEDNHKIKDAFPHPQARFEGGLVDDRKFVSFFRNGIISAVATTTPFSRTIKGQMLSFYVPKDLMPGLTQDPRYYPRTSFYPDGNVKEGLIVPVKHIQKTINNIKKSFLASRNVTFQVDFYSNYALKSITLPSYYSGSFDMLDGTYQVGHVRWWPHGLPSEVGFTKKYSFTLPGKGPKDVLYLLLGKDGKPSGQAL